MAKLSSYRLWLACFSVAVAAAATSATQFTVGGANGWSVPAAGAESFNTWAERTRFQVGDTLVFVYPKDQDSVLQVDPSDYNACNTSSYVQRFDDGDTVYALDRPGALFFISGVEANCRANEKLIVMVLAAARNATGGGGGAPAAPTTPAPPPASPSPPPASSAATPPPSPPAPKAPTAASPPPATSASAPPPSSAPTTPPSTPPPPAPRASSPAPPPSAPAGAPPAPPARSPAPSAQGTTTANSTRTPPSPPAGSKHTNGAALAVATGLSSSLGACVLGYAMLAL